MPGSCPYIKRDGSQCGLGMRSGFDLCGIHRPRGAMREFQPCTSCGVQTRRIVDGASLCVRGGCGLTQYRASLKARHKAEAAAAAQRETAALDDYIIALAGAVAGEAALPTA